MITEKEIEIIEVYELPKVFKLNLLSNGIIETLWDVENLDITKEHLSLLIDAIEELGGGKRMRVYLYMKDFTKINKEAMEFSAKVESSRFTLANAVLVNNLAKKLLFNFYIKFSAPTVPTLAFRDKEEAFKWLLSLSED